MTVWPLGLACVAEATRRAGHEVAMLDLMQEESPLSAIGRAVREFSPDVIGVSVRNIDDQSMRDTVFYLDEVREVIAICRNHTRSPIVLGGAGYSIFPASALDFLGADMGLPGEGEHAFPLLIDRIISGLGLQGPYLLYRRGTGATGRRSFIKHLDDYPLPDVHIDASGAYAGGDFWMPVQTRRGCAMACSYCSTPAIEGRTLRRRSPEEVVRWIGRCAERGVRHFHFVDNTFNLPTSYAKELCVKITAAKLGITWRCILYPWKIDAKLVELMARAGCVEASIGSESGSEEILHIMNKRFSPADVRLAADVTAQHGIWRMGFLMLGGPGERLETVEESLRFAESLRLDTLKITLGIRIYPETEVARRAVEDGLIAPDDDLLYPRFYMVPGVEEPLRRLAEKWSAGKKGWIV